MKFKTYGVLHSDIYVKAQIENTLTYHTKSDRLTQKIVQSFLHFSIIFFSMFKEPQNDKVCILLMHSEGPLRTAMTFAVHTTHTYFVILLKKSLYPND